MNFFSTNSMFSLDKCLIVDPHVETTPCATPGPTHLGSQAFEQNGKSCDELTAPRYEHCCATQVFRGRHRHEVPRNTRYLGTGENVRTLFWRLSAIDPSRGYCTLRPHRRTFISSGEVAVKHFGAEYIVPPQTSFMQQGDYALDARGFS